MLRLKPKADLKQGIKAFCSEHGIQSGAILSAVGSLSTLTVRIADGHTTEQRHENMELIAMGGTITDGHLHIHIAGINGSMEVFGGHLLDGCVVNTTMELVIGDYSALYQNRREFDPATGYDELVVVPR